MLSSRCSAPRYSLTRPSAVLFVVSLLLSCAPGETKAGLGPNEPSPIVQLSISPANASVRTDETLTFAALGVRQDGSTVATPVNWSASGGQITPDGVYAAGTVAGTFSIAASLLDGSLSALAPVTVLAAVSPIVSLSVSPSATGMNTGESQLFTATAARQDGSALVPAVTWSATGGTITTGGLYTAGSTAGTFRVIATQQGGALADTAAVDVTTPGTGPYAHRPANYTNTLTDYAFNTPIPVGGDTPVGDGSIWHQVFNSGYLSRVVDSSGPISPGFVLENHNYPGMPSGGGSGKLYANVDPNIDEFYIAAMTKWDSNYEWNPISNKFFIIEPDHIIIEARHNNNYLWVDMGSLGAYYTSNVATPTITLGTWHNIEIIVKRGNPGLLRIWMDGTLYMDRTVPVANTATGYQDISIANTWGGQTGPTTRDSYRWTDHILVATP